MYSDIVKDLKKILEALNDPKLSENDIAQLKYYLDKIEDKSNEILSIKDLNKEYTEKEDLQNKNLSMVLVLLNGRVQVKMFGMI